MECAEFFPRRPNRREQVCAVGDCSSKVNVDTNLRFHYFPAPNSRMIEVTDYFGNKTKMDKLKAWKKSTGVKIVTKFMMICSRHFRIQDYIYPEYAIKTLRLKRDAVPSCNLPILNKKQKVVDEARLKRRLQRCNKDKVLEQQKESQKVDQEHTSECQIEDPADVCEPIIKADSVEDLNADENVSANSSNTNEEKHTESYSNLALEAVVSEMQVCPSTNLQPMQSIGMHIYQTELKFIQLIKSDKQLSTVAGLESFKIFNAIVDIVQISIGKKYERGKIKMLTKDRVLMTYIKLKQNLSYNFLSVIFNCVTPTQCKYIFFDTVKILRECLRPAVPWPCKEEIRSNMPNCFKDFQGVRVVLDCTEVHIQRPKNLCCQIVTYSHYKSGQTCKFMTGVTPAGNISFISKPYGGRVSDSAIFEQSNLRNLLEPGDGVMVDKGFLVQELCKINQWNFIQPPFLKNKKQLTQEQALFTAKIAKARVHVERSNQRIKLFKIVGSTMPVNLVPIIGDIFFIICATINLSSPILKHDKFMKFG